MSMLKQVKDGKFAINVEFTPHSADEVRHIAAIAKGLVELNAKYEKEGLAFTGISLTQNPGGSRSYDHHASLAVLKEEGFPEDLEIMPHVTGKDMNVDAIKSLLPALAERGVTTVLALTGDLSDAAKGVFEVDSLGLLQVVKEVNVDLLKKGRTPEAFAKIPLLTPGAAVSPFKYTDGSLAMQYIKAAKKIREGAAFLVCQSGWDSERSEYLIHEIGDAGVPIFGNVLVVTEIVAKVMRDLAGCVITDALIKKLRTETADDSLLRAGRQLAMFRDLGYAGIDLGKPGEFGSVEEIEKIVDTALETKDWREHREDLTFPPPPSPEPNFSRTASFSKYIHNLVFEEDGSLHSLAKTVLTPFNKSVEREGALYRLFNALEGLGKGVIYECEHCGDCFLSENNFVCTKGGCEKGLPNPPCGDTMPDGTCGNNENKICAGVKVYYRMLHHHTLDAFKEVTLPPRDSSLHDSSSVLNYFFGRDHVAPSTPLEGSGLIQVAELLHASIPTPGAAMGYIQKLGQEGFTKPNRGLAYIEHLIETQAHQGADYIDINIDALGGENVPDLMRGFVRLVHKHGLGVPPCVDSSDVKVIQAGLDEWFALGGDTRAPLLNSIPHFDKEKFEPLLELRKKRSFSAICLLVGETGPLESADLMVDAAKDSYQWMTAAGFKPDQILFDCVTMGIASDGCMDAMGMVKASHTHHSFQAIDRIRKDPEMKGCHAVLGVSNWVYGAKKRRIGHIRAFIAAAQKRGLDAAIVDVARQFGIKPASPELVGFVESFAALDGNEDSMMTYGETMQNARQSNWI